MKIIIVGGGLAGLGSAILLKENDHEVEVYERDALHAEPEPGWSVSVKNDFDCAGTHALKAMGLWEDCIEHYGSSLEQFNMLTCAGTHVARLAHPGNPGLRIHRGQLRHAMLEALKECPNVKVIQGANCKGYRNDTERQKAIAILQGPDGTDREVEGDLLLACDGLYSPIRNQMKGDPLVTSGIIAVTGMGPTEILTPLTERSTFLSVGSGIAFTYANFVLNGKEMSNWAVMTKVSDRDFEIVRKSKTWGGCAEKSPQLKAKVLELVRKKKIHEPVEQIIQETPESNFCLQCSIDRNPVTNWRDGRVVLVGDAAHPATTFSGVGANHALVDAQCLAGFINEGYEVEVAVDAYCRTRQAITATTLLGCRRRTLAWVTPGWTPYLKTMLPFYLLGKIVNSTRRQKWMFLGGVTASMVGFVFGLKKLLQCSKKAPAVEDSP